MPIPHLLSNHLEMLRCPRCKNSGIVQTRPGAELDSLTCSNCGAIYPVEDGVPVLLDKDYHCYTGHDPDYEANFRKARVYFPPAMSKCKYNHFLQYNEVDFYRTKTARWEYDERLCRLVTNFFAACAPGKTLLNIGSGLGTFDHILNRDITPPPRIFGVELVKDGAIVSQKYFGNDSTQYLCGDAVNLPFHDNIFDFVYSKNAVEHAGIQLIDEMARVLKPGGQGILIGPSATATIFFHRHLFKKYLLTGDAEGFSTREYRRKLEDNRLQVKKYRAMAIQGYQRHAVFRRMPPTLMHIYYFFDKCLETVAKALGLKSHLWMQFFIFEKQKT